jgi:hypothetical protein
MNWHDIAPASVTLVILATQMLRNGVADFLASLPANPITG